MAVSLTSCIRQSRTGRAPTTLSYSIRELALVNLFNLALVLDSKVFPRQVPLHEENWMVPLKSIWRSPVGCVAAEFQNSSCHDCKSVDLKDGSLLPLVMRAS